MSAVPGSAEGIRAEIPVQCACQVHDGRVAAALADAGCVEKAAFGAESGSQQILDRIDKKTTVAQNYASSGTARRPGSR